MVTPTPTTEFAVVLFNTALGAHEQGDLAAAEAQCAQALELFQRVEGERLPNAASALNLLALIRNARGNYCDALCAAQQAIAILDARGTEFAGADAADLRVQAWGILGNLYRQLGEYAQAEPFLQRALDAAIAEFGETSEQASNARNDLGILYKYTGKFDRAEELYRTALENIERQMGRDHLATASLYHNLGRLSHALGEFAKGEPFARKAWEIRRHACGDDDPATLADAAAYAGVLDGLARYDESELIYREVLAKFEKLYGPEHYEIAINLNNLANICYARGDNWQAEALLRRAISIEEKILGAAHPDTALACNNLGVLLHAQNRAAEARNLFARALAVFESSLGAAHPQTLMTRENLEQVQGMKGNGNDVHEFEIDPART